jgi:nicotinamide mononucleotide transporter
MTNTLSIAAMILTVKRCMEQWLMWIAVNLIEVFMWWKVWTIEGNSISILLMWLLFLFNGIFFFIRWKKDTRRD